MKGQNGWLWLIVSISWMISGLIAVWRGESAATQMTAMMTAIILMKLSGRE